MIQEGGSLAGNESSRVLSIIFSGIELSADSTAPRALDLVLCDVFTFAIGDSHRIHIDSSHLARRNSDTVAELIFQLVHF